MLLIGSCAFYAETLGNFRAILDHLVFWKHDNLLSHDILPPLTSGESRVEKSDYYSWLVISLKSKHVHKYNSKYCTSDSTTLTLG